MWLCVAGLAGWPPLIRDVDAGGARLDQLGQPAEVGIWSSRW
jgi:hypothetical protein